MAQVLKKELKDKIIEAARTEFLEKGYKNASMRSIASKANMTVGNLYRYFKNKEEINLYIVAPTYKKIDKVINNLIKNEVVIYTGVFDSKPDKKNLNNIIEEFIDKLMEIYKSDNTEFKILFLHSRVDEKIIDWFKEVVNAYISQKFLLANLSTDKDVLTYAYGKAMYEGLKVIIDSDSSFKMIKQLSKTYLKSYIEMFDHDINELIG